MEPNPDQAAKLTDRSRRLARWLLTIGENRFELLMVELQEQRDRLLRAFLLTLGLAVFGLLAGVVLTGAIVVWLWPASRLAPLFVLTGIYGLTALWLFRRLTLLLRNWQNLPASIDQLRKDLACLEKYLL